MPFFADDPEVVAPRDLEGAPPVAPQEGSLLAAAARQENTIVSAYNFLTERTGFARDPQHNPIDIIGGTGYEAQYLDRFIDSQSEADTRARMSRIDREEQDRKLLDSNGFAGMAAQIAMGVLDPTMFIPAGTIYKGVRVGRAALKSSLMTGAAAGAVVAGQEAILYGSQELRTPGESTMNIAAGTILGGILGGAISKMSSHELSKLTDVFDGYRAEVNADLAGGTPASAGAASAASQGLTLAPALGTERLASRLSPVTRLQTSPFATAKATIRDMADAGLTYRENFDGVATSQGGTVETRAKMRRGPMIEAISQSDDAYARYYFGKTDVSFFERKTAATRAFWSRTSSENGGKLSAAEFRVEVGKAMRRNDEHPIPEVAEVAKRYRELVFDPLKDEAVRLGLLKGEPVETPVAPKPSAEELDALTLERNNEIEQVTARYLAAKVGEKPEGQARLKTWFDREIELIHKDFEQKSGVVRRPEKAPTKVAVVGADSYLTRVYNREKIIAKRDKFRAILLDFATRKRSTDIAAFERTNAQRVADLETKAAALEAKIGEQPVAAPKDERLKAFDEANEAELATLRAPLEMELDLLAHARDRDLAQAKSIYKQQAAAAKKGEKATLKAKLAEADARISLAHAEAVKKAEKQFAPMLRQFTKAKLVERKRLAKDLDAHNKLLAERDNLRDRITNLKTRQSEAEKTLPEELPGMVDDVINGILGEGALRLPGLTLMSGPKGPLAERVLRVPDAAIEEFLESDVEKIARVYTHSMSGDIELTAKFGKADLSDQIAKLTDELNAKQRRIDALEIAPVLKEKRRTKLQERYENDRRDLEALRDRVRGNYAVPDNPDGLLYRAGRIALSANYLARGGGFTIASLSDVGRPIMRYGLVSTLRDGWLPLIRDLGTFKLNARELRLAGTALDVVRDQRSMELRDLLDEYGRGNKFERGTQFVSDRFSTLNGMKYWNGGMKTLTGVVSLANVLRAVKAVSTGKATRKQIGILGAGGIDEAMARRIWAEAESTSTEVNGSILPNTEGWKDLGAVEAFRAVLNREVENAIVTPGLEKPLFMSKSWGKVIGQFKSFSLVSTQKAMIAGLQQRDAAALQGVIVMLAFGALSAKIKTELRGASTEDWTPEKWAVEAADASGLFGVLTEANGMAEKVTRGRVGLSAITGEEMTRFASRNAFGALLGPSVDLAADLTTLGGLGADDWSAADTRALRKVVPFQNLFYVRQLFDKIENSVNESFDIPARRPRR